MSKDLEQYLEELQRPSAWKQPNARLKALVEIENNLKGQVAELEPYVKRHGEIMRTLKKIEQEKRGLFHVLRTAVNRNRVVKEGRAV